MQAAEDRKNSSLGLALGLGELGAGRNTQRDVQEPGLAVGLGLQDDFQPCLHDRHNLRVLCVV
jgi:hypothetical protein